MDLEINLERVIESDEDTDRERESVCVCVYVKEIEK